MPSEILPPLTLYPKRLGSWFGFAIFLPLTIAGVYWSFSDPWMGGLAAVIFGKTTILCALDVLPGGAFLRLSKEGFIDRRFFRQTTYHWRDVVAFDVETDEHGTFIKFQLSLSGRDRLGIRNVASPAVRGLRGTYGMNAENLAALMNDFRQRHG